MIQINTSAKQKQTHKEYACGWQRGREVGEERNESLGLAEAKNYI